MSGVRLGIVRMVVKLKFVGVVICIFRPILQHFNHSPPSPAECHNFIENNLGARDRRGFVRRPSLLCERAPDEGAISISRSAYASLPLLVTSSKLKSSCVRAIHPVPPSYHRRQTPPQVRHQTWEGVALPSAMQVRCGIDLCDATETEGGRG